jgi:hypothetical protein
MRGPNEFWLSYHLLIEAYKAEGETPVARDANIIAQFQKMPPSVQRHIAEDMAEFLNVMAELLVSIRSETDADGKPARAKSIKRSH